MAEEYRNERKLLTPLSRQEVEGVIRHHPALFRPIHGVRQVNNIYLDTADNRNYFDNVDGFSHRQKVRIRWYQGLFGLVHSPTLEFKIKQGFVNRKVSYPLRPFTLDEGFSARTYRSIIEAAVLPEPLRKELLSLELRLLNCYTRKYFVSGDGRFRLTMDWSLSYYLLRQNGNLFRHRFDDRRHSVVELKYEPEANAQAPEITSRFPFRVTRSSKYVMGLDNLHGLSYQRSTRAY